MPNPADELRAAAKKIRAVAAKATPGPWLNLDHGDRIIRDTRDTRAWMDDEDGKPEYVVDEPLYANPANGDHFVLWHPGTAELVAELLDTIGRLSQPDRIDVIQVRVIAHGLAEAINGVSDDGRVIEP